MTSQLERDLTRRIRDRLGIWAGDSLALFSMGGLPPSIAVDAIVNAAFQFVAFLLTTHEVEPHVAAGKLMALMREMAKDDEAEEAREQGG